MACEEAQELHCFGAEPAADLDADHRVDSAARSRVPGKSRSACAVQRPPRRRAGGLRRVWRGGETMVASSASCEPCQRGGHWRGPRCAAHRRQERPGSCPRAGRGVPLWRQFHGIPRDGVLERQRASGQNARGGTGRAVVTEGVEYPVAASSARCEREGQAQAPQQQDPELTCAHRMHGQPNAASPGTATGRQLGLVQGARRPRSI